MCTYAALYMNTRNVITVNTFKRKENGRVQKNSRIVGKGGNSWRRQVTIYFGRGGGSSSGQYLLPQSIHHRKHSATELQSIVG
jgi:hypothetical protein